MTYNYLQKISGPLLDRIHIHVRDWSQMVILDPVLLTRIGEGFPEDFWKRYRELIARREARNLSPAELTELIALLDQVELKNAERASYLVALARLRSIPLSELIRQIGLHPEPVATL